MSVTHGEIARIVESFVSFMEARFGLPMKLEWTEVGAVERALGGVEDEELSQLRVMVPLGLYLGEILVRRAGGEWSQREGEPRTWEVELPHLETHRPVQLAWEVLEKRRSLAQWREGILEKPFSRRLDSYLARSFEGSHSSEGCWWLRYQGWPVELEHRHGELGEVVILGLALPLGALREEIMALSLVRNRHLSLASYCLERERRELLLRLPFEAVRVQRDLSLIQRGVRWMVEEATLMMELLEGLP